MCACSPLTASACVLLYLAGWAGALKDIRIFVPAAAQVGQTLQLSCAYDLEESPLYSITWYHDDTEFYRYVPKEQPATRVFSNYGINVDLARSDSNNVTLFNVTRYLEGFYKCEVSAEPNFHTEIQGGFLHVFEPPNRKPELTTQKLPGGVVRANCSTAPSNPAANITWYIDGRPYAGMMATQYHNVEASEEEWVSSSVEVEVSSRRSLRCEASIHGVWRKASDETPLREDQPQLASVLGPSSSACGMACGLTALLAAALLPTRPALAR